MNFTIHTLTWRIAGGILFYFFATTASRIVGDRLEKIRGQGLLSRWLFEVGSDVRRFGRGISLITGITIALSQYPLGLKWGFRAMSIAIVILVATFCSVFALVWGEWLRDNLPEGLSGKDETVTKTLIPLIVESTRMLCYGGAFIGVLAVLGVDVKPILNASGFVVLVGGLALQQTLQDAIAGLKILFARLYSVGDEITVHGVSGKVVAITWLFTIVEVRREGRRTVLYKTANRTIDKVKVRV